jgi:subtilisin-like proprotein convertase family protein
VYQYGAINLRNGKGALYVKAAGNGFNKLGNDFESEEAFAMAVKLNITCQNSSMNTDNTLPEVITVGALSAKGKKTSYSTTGSSIWISAPGGEFGFDKVWVNSNYQRFGKTVDWSGLPPTLGEPAIVTTDVIGSQYGMSKLVDYDNLYSIEDVFDVRNTFNVGNATDNDGKYLNSEFNYTNTMNGTSSAAPVTTGSIAIILEANPNLTWRDVKYILAKTATKVDPNFSGVTIELANGEKYQAEDGWITNAAGFNFSNWYGFGRINLSEAVKLAKNFCPNLIKFRCINLGKYHETGWYPLNEYATNIDVPAGATGYTYALEIPKNKNINVKIESVRAEVSINSDFIGDVGIELTSPNGTKSIIWNTGNAFSNQGNLDKMPIQSNAFYREYSSGTWTFKIINSGFNAKKVTVKGLRLQFAGSSFQYRFK